MNKKSVLVFIIWTILFSIFFWYTLVFWVWAFFGEDIQVVFKLSKNIYPNSLYLRDNKIAFKSNIDISNYNLISTCNTYWKFISKNKDIYIFNLKFFDNLCNDNYVFLTDLDNKKVSAIKFNIINEYKLYSNLIDYETPKLNSIYSALDKKKNNLIRYWEKYNTNFWGSYNDYILNNRALNEVLYNYNILKSIIESRKKKYLIPIKWNILPTNPNKLPNSSRAYRSDYTDWIHHGWDFNWNFWEQVIAIDDWIIIRVVSNFNFNNLNNIIRWNNILNSDKIKNLDILRGNQVWLKTNKWDVAFYSHLNDVYSNIKEGEIVRRWQPIWTIWITWIPDRNYIDYHLHLDIQKNPYNLLMVWKYDYDDYMNWDWYFKWKNLDTILENQTKIFEN